MNNKELIDKINIKLISVCNEKCKECKYIDCCTCMYGLKMSNHVGVIDYKYLDLESIARDLNIK